MKISILGFKPFEVVLFVHYNLFFVIVFPCGLDFSVGPWAITPENLPTGR